jgi:hypothetical protein
MFRNGEQDDALSGPPIHLCTLPSHGLPTVAGLKARRALQQQVFLETTLKVGRHSSTQPFDAREDLEIIGSGINLRLGFAMHD